MTKIFMQVIKKLMFTNTYLYLYLYVYQINIYWSENEKNGLNNGKYFKVKMLYFQSKLWQLGFWCTHELHN
jgi:hypothetical protein